MANFIYFVSLGPGEPELITLKGWKALQQSDAIFCPATRTKAGDVVSRAAEIVRALQIDEKKIRTFVLPMRKERGEALQVYEQLLRDVKQLHSEGRQVAITAEGDAGFYTSIQYIYGKLEAEQLPIRRIAGIPAFIAAGAAGGLHIVKQEERLVVIPGTATADELDKYLSGNYTIVIMKLSACVDAVHQCIARHPDAEFHYFENVGTPNKYYTSDRDIIGNKSFPYFSLIIIQKA